MLLTIDIGNSSISLGLFDLTATDPRPAPVLTAKLASAVGRTADEYAVIIRGLLADKGYDGAIYGARAAYIGGCDATACAIDERDFGIPAVGTMAHSWIQLFGDELEAFRAYARQYPDNCTLLVDTYNVLKSGIPNAIKAFVHTDTGS